MREHPCRRRSCDAAGLGAAAGPLIGGVVTSAISWRASFGLQVLVVAWIILLARKIADAGPEEPKPRFDLMKEFFDGVGEGFSAGVWEDAPADRPEFRERYKRQLERQAKARKAEEEPV